jgi:hypothetical protein
VTRLVAATGRALAVIEGRGDTWEVSLTAEPAGAQCIAADPSEPRILYAGCRGGSLWRSEDAGGSWADAGLRERDIFSVAVSPADGAVYAGTEPSRLFVSRGGAWKELDALQRIPSQSTWSFPPRPWTSHVRWIAPSPHEAGLLLVGIELGGLMRSADGGESFEDHRPGARPDVHCLAWHPHARGRAYETAGEGAAWSTDHGETWAPADDGMDRHYTWALAPDPADPARWYASASTGPFQAHGQRGRAAAHVYRMRPDQSWELLGGGLPQPLDSMPYALLLAGETLVAGLRDGRLYLSDDRGDTWRAAQLTGDALPSIVALVSV